jgi:hypothetical protein
MEWNCTLENLHLLVMRKTSSAIYITHVSLSGTV